MKNALTVDLEDWYHVCGVGEYADPSKWDEYESRVSRSTEKILSILASSDARATFFVLGYIARKNPALIKAVSEAGHEVATHGYYHRRVFDMTPSEFEDDITESVGVIESITGKKVAGYRAPEWSMRRDTFWALETLRRLGLSYDSSMVPLTRMGERSFGKYPHRIDTRRGPIYEFPLTTFRCLWENLPYTGGLPMRIAPYWFILEGIKRLNSQGRPGMIYVHPWEFDRERPRLDLPLSKRFMHYFNTGSTEPKLRGLLKHLEFTSISECLGIGL